MSWQLVLSISQDSESTKILMSTCTIKGVVILPPPPPPWHNIIGVSVIEWQSREGLNYSEFLYLLQLYQFYKSHTHTVHAKLNSMPAQLKYWRVGGVKVAGEEDSKEVSMAT